MKTILNAFYLIFSILFSLGLRSQDKVINLYPERKIPFRIDNNIGDVFEYENGLIRRKNTTQNPTIETYYPKTVLANMPAVLICPSGGYGLLSHLSEGIKVAKLLRDAGIVGIIVNS